MTTTCRERVTACSMKRDLITGPEMELVEDDWDAVTLQALREPPHPAPMVRFVPRIDDQHALIGNARRSSLPSVSPRKRSTAFFFGSFTHRYRSLLDLLRKSDRHARPKD
jgi:hypothetical protein